MRLRVIGEVFMRVRNDISRSTQTVPVVETPALEVGGVCCVLTGRNGTLAE